MALTAGGLLLTFIGGVVKIMHTINEREDELREDVMREITAMRARHTETELWNRDHFVRKESFELVVGRLDKSIERLGDQFSERFDRFEQKIDRLQGRSVDS